MEGECQHNTVNGKVSGEKVERRVRKKAGNGA